MARTPDKRENQRRFAELDPAQRRAIIKAVNRGQPVAVRKHAPMAVGLAQRQKRFWKYSWLLGPALAILQAATVGIEVGLINGGVVTLALIGASWWFGSRASRAELLNRDIAEGRKAPARTVTAPSGSGSKASGGGSPWWRFWDRSGRTGDEGGGSSDGARGGTARGGSARGGSSGGGSSRGGGHLPKATGKLRSDGDKPAAGSGGASGGGHGGGQPSSSKKPPVDPNRAPPGQRPYQPRRKKRRRR